MISDVLIFLKQLFEWPLSLLHSDITGTYNISIKLCFITSCTELICGNVSTLERNINDTESIRKYR